MFLTLFYNRAFVRGVHTRCTLFQISFFSPMLQYVPDCCVIHSNEESPTLHIASFAVAAFMYSCPGTQGGEQTIH